MSESARATLDLAHGFGEVLALWTHRAAVRDVTPLETEKIATYLRQIGEQISLASSDGHTCLPLSTVLDLFPGEVLADLRSKLLASKLVCTPLELPPKPLVLDGANRLFLYRNFERERQLARRLVERARLRQLHNTPFSSLRAALEDSLERIDESYAATVSRAAITLDWQRIAVAQALLSPLTLISGGPGTGKTRTAARLIECIRRLFPDARIALAAPTGKAAGRLRDAVGPELKPLEATTLHRLLSIHPSSGQAQYHAKNPLPFDLVVVDEASMLDLTLALQLLEALPPEAQCVLLGDKDQLPPVETGSVFATLSRERHFSPQGLDRLAQVTGYPAMAIQSALASSTVASPLTDQVVWLEKNYRFSNRSSIGILSDAIKRGHTASAIEILRDPQSEGLLWLEDNRPRIDKSTLQEAELGYAGYRTTLEHSIRQGIVDQSSLEELFEKFDQFRVLAAIRQTGRGVVELNMQLRRLIDPGTRTWYPGRPILITRNDPGLRLFNGDVGICMPHPSGDRKPVQVWFREQTMGDSNPFRAVECDRLPPHEDALAMTVHKAQGSEFESVLLVLPYEATRTANRALLYTAITRARQRVIVSGSQPVFEMACSKTDDRPSGLSDRIRELIDAYPSNSLD